MHVIENPELKAAENDPVKLHAALRVAFGRCPADIPQLLGILAFRREVRIAGELSLDGMPLNQGRF